VRQRERERATKNPSYREKEVLREDRERGERLYLVVVSCGTDRDKQRKRKKQRGGEEKSETMENTRGKREKKT